MTRPHAKPRGDAPAPPPRGRPDEPSAPPPPFDTPATTADALEAHRDTVDALEKELKQASIDAGMSEVRVAFAREILDHAEREHQANVLRYDSVMVALQEANRTSATSNGGAHEPPAPPDQEHRRQPNRRDGGDQGADEAPRVGTDSADLRRRRSESGTTIFSDDVSHVCPGFISCPVADEKDASPRSVGVAETLRSTDSVSSLSSTSLSLSLRPVLIADALVSIVAAVVPPKGVVDDGDAAPSDTLGLRVPCQGNLNPPRSSGEIDIGETFSFCRLLAMSSLSARFGDAPKARVGCTSSSGPRNDSVRRRFGGILTPRLVSANW